jgi:hypothetical protein
VESLTSHNSIGLHGLSCREGTVPVDTNPLHYLIPYGKFNVEMNLVAVLVNKFTFYGTESFIAVFTNCSV